MITRNPYGVDRAVRPWDSLDAAVKPQKVHTCDSPLAVERCLKCTLPPEECTGQCPTLVGEKRRGGRKGKVDPDQIRRLNTLGHTNAEIARILGVSENTVANWLKKMGLKRAPTYWSVKKRIEIMQRNTRSTCK